MERALFDDALALGRAAVPLESIESWRARHRALVAGIDQSIDRAILAGAVMDRIGYAFASGYTAALGALVPGLTGFASLLATEAGGAHPRAIQATLTPRPVGGFILDGEKEWCTLGPVADVLLVVARTGTDALGRPLLRVARVDVRKAGVGVEARSETPFVPEVPHARVVLRQVELEAADVLPGDGYEHYLKPFRTIEDVHVHAAVSMHLAALAERHRFDPDLFERSLAVVAALRGLASLDPGAPATHLALAGVLSVSRALLGHIEPAILALGGDVAARWSRDRPLLEVAGRAREARREAARRRLFGAPIGG